MVDGPRANSQTRVALYEHPCAAIQLVLDQSLVVVAASLEQIVEIVARMALDGATSLLQIVPHALAASMLLPALQCALVVALRPPQHRALSVVVVASGALIVAIVAMMVQVGATSPALIVQHVQGRLMAAPLSQHAGELLSDRLVSSVSL